MEEDRLLAELETLREAQIEIEHSQQLYAELFDSAPVGYFNLTAEGGIQNANLAACALLGRERTRIVGKPFYIFVASSDMQKFTDHLRRCGAAEVGETASELRLYARGTEPRYVELLSRRSSLFGTTETIYRTVVRDITDRRQAEDALRESEERTRVLSANLPGGAAFVLDRSLRCLLAGGEALESLSVDPQDLVGRRMEDAKPELAEVYTPFFRQLLEGRTLLSGTHD